MHRWVFADTVLELQTGLAKKQVPKRHACRITRLRGPRARSRRGGRDGLVARCGFRAGRRKAQVGGTQHGCEPIATDPRAVGWARIFMFSMPRQARRSNLFQDSASQWRASARDRSCPYGLPSSAQLNARRRRERTGTGPASLIVTALLMRSLKGQSALRGQVTALGCVPRLDLLFAAALHHYPV